MLEWMFRKVARNASSKTCRRILENFITTQVQIEIHWPLGLFVLVGVLVWGARNSPLANPIKPLDQQWLDLLKIVVLRWWAVLQFFMKFLVFKEKWTLIWNLNKFLNKCWVNHKILELNKYFYKKGIIHFIIFLNKKSEFLC